MAAEAGRGRVPLSSPCCPEAPHLRLLHQGFRRIATRSSPARYVLGCASVRVLEVSGCVCAVLAVVVVRSRPGAHERPADLHVLRVWCPDAVARSWRPETVTPSWYSLSFWRCMTTRSPNKNCQCCLVDLISWVSIVVKEVSMKAPSKCVYDNVGLSKKSQEISSRLLCDGRREHTIDPWNRYRTSGRRPG